MALSLSTVWPLPVGAPTKGRRRVRVAAMSTAPASAISSASASWGSIPLGKVLQKLQPLCRTREAINVDADMPGCTVMGTLCKQARVYPESCVETFLQDGSATLKVIILNFATRSTRDSEARIWFPQGAKVRIVGPRVILGEGRADALLVENPASVQMLSVELPSKEQSGELFFEAANAAVRRGEFRLAAHYYRQCIEHGFPDALKAYSGSSMAWFKLEWFERAYVDADKALGKDPSHFQSLFVKAKSLCQLKEYSKALECFQEAVTAASSPEDKLKAEEELKKCATLNQQSSTGVYNLADFCLSGRLPASASDCADFIGPVKIEPVEGKGRGLFATKDLKAGELVVAVGCLGIARRGGEEFRAKFCRECMVNRRTLAQAIAFFENLDACDLDLFRPNIGWWFRNKEDDSRRSVSYNSWVKDLGPKRNALCPLGTMLNHSCLPNVSRRMVGSTLFIRAARDISQGEELVTSYTNNFVPVSIRRMELARRGLNFGCSCARCQFEEEIERKNPALSKGYLETQNGILKGSHAFNMHMRISQELDAMAESESSRRWLMSSFMYAYGSAAYAADLSMKETKLEETMLALRETAPGDAATLMHMVNLLTEGNPDRLSLVTERQRDLLRKQAVSAFGEQSDEVLDAIVRNPVVPSEDFILI